MRGQPSFVFQADRCTGSVLCSWGLQVPGQCDERADDGVFGAARVDTRYGGCAGPLWGCYSRAGAAALIPRVPGVDARR